MNKVFNFIADGFINIAEAYVTHRNYVLPSHTGFLQDREKLRGDLKRVGQNMRTAATAQYGKQSNKR